MALPLQLCFLSLSLIAAIDPRIAFKHAIKRQAYYVCGVYPNQYYSATPCDGSGTGNQCANGGSLLGVGCNVDYDCIPYAAGAAVQCVSGCCCTAPSNGGGSTFGYCPSGQQSQVSCGTNNDCSSGETCNNGLCCTTTGMEYSNACGGQAALSSCDSSQSCGGSFNCVTSNYCCECQFGSSGGSCTNGACPQGYMCSTNGYCCAYCSNGQAPFGVCQNGMCPDGYTCNAGNVCCGNN